MARINFTEEHLNKLKDLSLKMLFNNNALNSKLGQSYTIQELLHCVTINTLNSIRISLNKKIELIENQDEWISDSTTQKEFEQLKETKELVNLIIGYKRFKLEEEEIKAKKAELSSKINALKEAQKTPEDKIKELEKALAELN